MSLHHFRFVSPDYLFVLLVVPLLFVFARIVRHRRSRYAATFTNLAMLAGIARRPRRLRGLPLVLFALALTVSAAALARPRLERSVSDRGATIILLADVSGSMAATDIRPARIFAAANAMQDLVEELPPNDKVGLVTFSDTVDILDAPTTDHAAVQSGLNVLNPAGGTALGDGVEEAVKVAVATLAAEGVHRTADGTLPAAIVLESDGAQDRGHATTGDAAEFAKAAGVRIYGVALGTRGGTIVEGHGLIKQVFEVPPDPEAVAILARTTGGEAFNATNAEGLDTIYRKLGSSIGRLEQDEQIGSWFDLAAAVLLVAAVATARVRGAVLP